MSQQIRTIALPMPFRLGSVNCYLVETDAGFVLVDTGASKGRAELESELTSAGCEPGDLALIVLTHGDFDHTSNAAYLGAKFGAQIVMHRDDAGMVERGDMFWNRKSGNALVRMVSRFLPVFFGFGKSQRFKPALYIEEGTDLSAYGFDARVVHMPGHSRGSIGFLTANDDLFCGDLLENYDEPAVGSIVDDPVAMQASVEKLKGLEIGTVYPGHGSPFPMDLFSRDDPET